MNHVCIRGAFLLTRETVPHMAESEFPHILTVAPAPIGDRTARLNGSNSCVPFQMSRLVLSCV